MNSSVEDWLRSLNLLSYTQAFIDNGYDELDICKEIGEEDLDAIGVLNRRDRADILNAVERLKTGGTAVYFVLEQCEDPQPSAVQLKRENFPPLKLRMLLHEKLEEDKINLAVPPYTNVDGSRGELEPLAKYFSDKLYAHEEEVLQALENLRYRQAGQCNYADCGAKTKERASSDVSMSAGSPHKGSPLHRKQQEDEKKHQQATAKNHTNSKMQPAGPAKGVSPLDYLNVDSHSSESGKQEKRRRPVERNTKLSRSLDSLKELHVNLEPKLRDREPSSFRFMKLFHHSKKKPHSGTGMKGQSLEAHPSLNMSIQASNITMSEEDRMALMIMVKQGELTPEEAIEQWKSYEDDHAKEKTDKESEEEKHGGKAKLRRGIWSKGSKRKSSSRPSSADIIASEMTMCEEDRITLMKKVKSGEMTTEEALQRLASYEEKHKGTEDTAANKEKQGKPRSPRTRGNFAKISIKRVSTALSSSFRVPSKEEPNSVFYTNSEGTDELETSSQDQSAESSPDSSPAIVQQTSYLRSSLRKGSTKSASSLSSPAELSSPSFLSEIKVAVARHSGEHKAEVEERRGSTDQPNEDVHPNLKTVPLCNKYEKAPPPTPERKQFVPFPDGQVQSNPVSTMPKVPPRQGTIKATPAQKIQESVSGGESEIATRVQAPTDSDAVAAKPPKIVATKPPPLPPRPALRKSSLTVVDSERSTAPHVDELSVKTKSKPPIPKPGASSDAAALPAKPSIKPKPKPKPRLKPKSSASSEDSSGDSRDAAPCTDSAADSVKGIEVQEHERPRPASRDAPPRKPIPRQRHSPSLGDMVERRLQTDGIDLTLPPYTDEDGRWGVPFNLIDRYAEEMSRPRTEIAECVEVIRQRNLKKLERQAIPCDVLAVTSSAQDEVQVHSLEAWLTSLGLPKYINSFIDVDYGDMEMMPCMTEKHFEYVGVFDPRHMRRLLSAVEKLRGSDELVLSDEESRL